MRISDWSSDVCSSDLLAELARPTPDRLLVAAQALREGLSVEEIPAVTKYVTWFLERIEEIIEAEQGVCDAGLPLDADGLRLLKAMAFSDTRLDWLALHSAHLTSGTPGAFARGSGLIHATLLA